jgi:hypothetical protein
VAQRAEIAAALESAWHDWLAPLVTSVSADDAALPTRKRKRQSDGAHTTTSNDSVVMCVSAAVIALAHAAERCDALRHAAPAPLVDGTLSIAALRSLIRSSDHDDNDGQQHGGNDRHALASVCVRSWTRSPLRRALVRVAERRASARVIVVREVVSTLVECVELCDVLAGQRVGAHCVAALGQTEVVACRLVSARVSCLQWRL